MNGIPNKTLVNLLMAFAFLAVLVALSWPVDRTVFASPTNWGVGAPAGGAPAPQQPLPTFPAVRLLFGCGGPLEPGQATQGTILTPGQECIYTFEGASGEVVSITMERLDGDLNPFLELYDPDGRLLDSNDDMVSGNLNSHLNHGLEQNGTYQVVARSYGPQTGSFTVTLSFVVPTSMSLPWCSSDDREIRNGEAIDGAIEPFTPDCRYVFVGDAGQIITVRMERTSGDLDPRLRLWGPSPSGELQVESQGDDEYGRNSLILHHRLGSSGEYQVEAAADTEQSSGEFRLELTIGPFRKGDQVQVVHEDGASLRKTPGYLRKPSGDLLMTARPGSILTIAGGPTRKDGLTWWRVRYGQRIGWTEEINARQMPILAPPF